MLKEVVLNLTGFTAYNPIMVVDTETNTTTIPHCVPRHLIANFAAMTAKDFNTDTIKYIDGTGAEDIVEELINRGFKLERIEHL